MARAPTGPLSALTATSLALVLTVLFAAALIRLAGDALGDGLAAVRIVHRIAASAAALVILAVGWIAWRAGQRALAAAIVVLMLALSALGAATGTSPPPPAAAGNLLGALLLAALLAWMLGRGARRGGAPLLHALAALTALQAALGAWCSIFEQDTWTFALIGHAPLAGLVSGLLDAPAAAAVVHAAAAALLVTAAAYAHARLT